MIDIDDFKSYNDKYHHLKGDEVIKETAKVIRKNIRKDDWAARFGGDEFVIVLPGSSAKDAMGVAERIRKEFHEIEFMPADKVVRKSLSMGVANAYYSDGKIVQDKKTSGMSTFEKIASEVAILADAALYTAKRSGKNKISVSRKPLTFQRVL
jgi:diguanylate cyclase (GGDEF)-like protein